MRSPAPIPAFRLIQPGKGSVTVELHPLDIALHMLNIVVLFVLLRALVYKPVRKFMRARADGIQKQIDEAQRLADENAAAGKAGESRLAEAGAEAAALLARSQKQAAELIDAAAKEAEAQAKKRIRQTDETIRQMKRDASAAMETQITEMALALAAELLSRELSAADQQAAIDAFFHRGGLDKEPRRAS